MRGEATAVEPLVDEPADICRATAAGHRAGLEV